MWLSVTIRLALLTALASAQLIDFYEPWVPESSLFEGQKDRPIVYSFESLSPKRQNREPTCSQLRRIWRRLNSGSFRPRRTQIIEEKPKSFLDPAKNIYGVLRERQDSNVYQKQPMIYGKIRDNKEEMNNEEEEENQKSFLDEIRANVYPDQKYGQEMMFGSVRNEPKMENSVKTENSAFQKLRLLMQQEQERGNSFEKVRQRLREEQQQQRMLRRQEGRRRRENRLRRLHHNAHLALQHRPWPIYRY